MASHSLDVIIVTYNSRDVIDACLDHLYNACGARDAHVIIVDNASTDGTADHIKTRWPKVLLFEQTSNAGFAAANNVGLAAARAEFVLLLNPDAFMHSTAVTSLLTSLRNRPRAAIVGPRLLNADGSLQASCRDFPSLLGDLVGMAELYRSAIIRRLLARQLAYFDQHLCAHEVDWLSGACLLVRRAALASAGYMDARYFMYSEEMEWQYRIKRCGWEIWFEPGATATHIGGASTSGAPGERIIWQYQSMFRFYNRYRNGWQRAALRTLVWAVTWPKLLVLAVRSRGNTRRKDLLQAFWTILWLR